MKRDTIVLFVASLVFFCLMLAAGLYGSYRAGDSRLFPTDPAGVTTETEMP